VPELANDYRARVRLAHDLSGRELQKTAREFDLEPADNLRLSNLCGPLDETCGCSKTG